MSEVKWIKIKVDIFNDEKIQLIETMPDADTIIVIWFKLLALAGLKNDGGIIRMNDKMAYTEDMLATIFRRKKTVVLLALETFKQFGMVDIVDNVLLINNWEKHQNIDGLDKIKLQNKERQQRYRDNQKNLLIEPKEKKKDKELDKELDIEKKRYEYVTVTLREVIKYLNEKAKKNFRYSSSNTKTKITARLNENYTLEDFKRVILIKTAEWINTEMDQYLRPQTLFGPNFESYLNQKEITRQGRNKKTLPEDIKSDWLDDYIKDFDNPNKVDMRLKDDYCKAHKININEAPDDITILEWKKERKY